MKSYTLKSSELVHTPGVLSFARQLFREAPDIAERILADGFHLSRPLARQLLDGSIKYRIDGDSVLFETVN